MSELEQEVQALRERVADMSLQIVELEGKLEALEGKHTTLSDSVDIVSYFAIRHKQEHDAVLKLTRGEKIIELMQVGYMLDDIDKRDREKRKQNGLSPKAREITGVTYISEQVRRI